MCTIRVYYILFFLKEKFVITTFGIFLQYILYIESCVINVCVPCLVCNMTEQMSFTDIRDNNADNTLANSTSVQLAHGKIENRVLFI